VTCGGGYANPLTPVKFITRRGAGKLAGCDRETTAIVKKGPKTTTHNGLWNSRLFTLINFNL
jgi:hypothetical protein